MGLPRHKKHASQRRNNRLATSHRRCERSEAISGQQLPKSEYQCDRHQLFHSI